MIVFTILSFRFNGRIRFKRIGQQQQQQSENELNSIDFSSKKPDGKFHVASKIWIFIIKFINSFYLSLLFVVFHIHHVYIGKEWERDSKERRIMMNFYFYFFCFRYYLQTMRLMIKIVS